jgi:serine/threonine protein phosphatase PrpC
LIGSLRRPIHRGSALAHGVFLDARALGEDAARRRTLDLAAGAADMHRCGHHLVILFAEPTRLLAGESPGGLLVRQGNILSAAPLAEQEIALFDGPDLSVLLVLGGAPTQHRLDASTRQDPASWLDVSDFDRATDVEPLGHVERSPAARLAPVAVDVRATLGVGDEASGAAAARAAVLASLAAAAGEAPATRGLFGTRATGGRDSRGGGDEEGSAPSGIAAALGGAVGGLFLAIAQILAALLPRSASPPDDDAGDLSSTGGRGGRRSRALAVHDEPRPAVESPLASLARGLGAWAARLLVWSRLARHVGRRQAAYLSRMMEMFDRGDLDLALRHAIAIDGKSAGQSVPALGTPSPRGSLAIAPGQVPAATSLFGTHDLLSELRRVYRRAFEQLAAKGEIDKAAFVLAELLHANEEAVSFLERHGRWRLAAQIAEARDLPPGLVVRQWFLAGDPARAVTVARAQGAFQEAVSRLRAAGNGREAASLELLWADALATAGDYAAAIDLIWPQEAARPLALRWLDSAIAVGGTVAARMAIRKAKLVPDAFDEQRDTVLALLREPGEDGLANARAMAQEIARGEPDAATRAFAKPVLRALLRSSDEDDAKLANTALRATGDAALQADVRRMQGKLETADPARSTARTALRATAAAVTHVGHARKHNEDGCLARTLSGPKKPGNKVLAIDEAARRGLVLIAADGCGGRQQEGAVADLVCSLIAEHLAAGAAAIKGAGAQAELLEQALSHANHVLFNAGRTDEAMRGAGATVAAATLFGATLIVAHAGDCRAYLWRDGALTRLTRDHSLVNSLLDEGKLTPAEVEDFPHKNVITLALGTAESFSPTITTTALCDGDVLLLCSDGVWGVVPDADLAWDLARAESTPEICAEIVKRWSARNGPDDVSIAVARFEGKRLPSRGTAPVTPVIRAPNSGAPAAASPSPSPTKTNDADAPLCRRAEPIEIRVVAGDTGALRILDAAELPDGRLLVALGEAGSRLVSRDGRTLARFTEPAHSIVISDHGDRALVLAPRGGAWRIARLDLTSKRQQPWCDARIGPFAPDFDGSIWYVASGATLHAIDVTTDGWERLWSVDEEGTTVRAVARSRQQVSVLLQMQDTRALQMWPYLLPAHRHHHRRRIAPPPGEDRARPMDLALSPSGNVAVVDPSADALSLSFHTLGHRTAVPLDVPAGQHGLAMSDAWLVAAWIQPTVTEIHVLSTIATSVVPRARVVFEGRELRPGARIAGDRLLVFDDRGRLLVISLRTGRVIRDLRLS